MFTGDLNLFEVVQISSYVYSDTDQIQSEESCGLILNHHSFKQPLARTKDSLQVDPARTSADRYRIPHSCPFLPIPIG